MKARKKNENSFESGMEALTHLAEQLESGNLGLDESLKAFEDGVRLYRELQEQLESARMRIEIIAAENDPEKNAGEEVDTDELR